jgi:MoaE-MoaD fusion protein
LKIRVLYFASARDLASTKAEVLAVPEGCSVEDLSAEVLRLHPPLKGLKNSVKFCVNLRVVGGEAMLREGDEVGVLPPVAGG